jgi:2-polyprenyl-3-methyl-5-hydroxy-6-metoxy-1,4-benzoquinol methylase
MEKLNNCPVCGKSDFRTYLTVPDFFLSKEEFTIVMCKDCEFKFVNPRPKYENLGKYYESEEYISHSNTSIGLVNSVYQKIRKHTHKKKFNLVTNCANGKTILDIGCASGELLYLFKNNGWKTSGIEPNENARSFAINNYGLNIFDESAISGFENEKFDAITMWHVLEHVSDLNGRISEIKRILKKNGVFIVAVPNCDSYDANYYKEFWAAYDVPRHLYHFTPKTIESLMSKFNFKIEKILPMKFDSYYVSLLSEKYKKGKTNYFSAFKNGLKSNMKADKNKYSSQIYILIQKN